MRVRRSGLLAALILAAGIGVLFADWREWIDWPDIISEFRSFDRFHIKGEAPWCFLSPSGSDYYFVPEQEAVFCHYLSEDHCASANRYDMRRDKPDERGQCVRNPIK